MNAKINEYIDILFKNVPTNKNVSDLKNNLKDTYSCKFENYIKSGIDEISAYNMIAKDLKNVDELIIEANKQYKNEHNENDAETIFDFCLSSELREEQIFESNIDEIVVKNISYSIGIDYHDENNILIQFYSTKNNPLQYFTIDCSNGILTVKQKKEHKIIMANAGKIIIKVPSHKLYKYNLNTISGIIAVNVESESLVTNSISGNTKIVKTGKYLNCSTTSGYVKIYSPFQNINVGVVSGGIKLVIGSKTQTVKLSTVSGSIKIALRDNVGYTICSATVLGRIKNKYNNEMYKNGKNCVYGNGQVKISASTVSGSIKLEEWQ